MAKNGTSQTQDPKAPKPQAARYPVNQLVVLAAYTKVFSTGKRGFFGQAQDLATGQKFQIIGAVEIASK